VGLPEVVRALPMRVAVLYGADSAVVSPETQEYMRWWLGEHVSHTAIPAAEHHCFLDQPLAVVSGQWPVASGQWSVVG
jgi:pimeloyl-ACP methyl ester carboxylesterase